MVFILPVGTLDILFGGGGGGGGGCGDRGIMFLCFVYCWFGFSILVVCSIFSVFRILVVFCF